VVVVRGIYDFFLSRDFDWEDCLVNCDTVLSGSSVPTFHGNLMPSSKQKRL
jgi:hypothetical protein